MTQGLLERSDGAPMHARLEMCEGGDTAALTFSNAPRVAKTTDILDLDSFNFVFHNGSLRRIEYPIDPNGNSYYPLLPADDLEADKVSSKRGWTFEIMSLFGAEVLSVLEDTTTANERHNIELYQPSGDVDRRKLVGKSITDSLDCLDTDKVFSKRLRGAIDGNEVGPSFQSAVVRKVASLALLLGVLFVPVQRDVTELESIENQVIATEGAISDAYSFELTVNNIFSDMSQHALSPIDTSMAEAQLSTNIEEYHVRLAISELQEFEEPTSLAALPHDSKKRITQYLEEYLEDSNSELGDLNDQRTELFDDRMRVSREMVFKFLACASLSVAWGWRQFRGPKNYIKRQVKT